MINKSYDEDRLDSNILLIIITALIALLIKFYNPILYPILGSIPFISLINQQLCFIPIALSAFTLGFKGGIIAALGFSLFSILSGITFYQGPDVLSETIAEIISYLSMGIIAGWVAEKSIKQIYDEEQPSPTANDRERTEALERFAKSVADDVRQPLSSLRNAINDLKSQQLENDNHHSIEIISREIDRLSGVVMDYLDFATPKVTYTDHINVPSVLDTVVRQAKQQADRLGVRLVFQNKEVNGFTRGNEKRLERMFLNILINALQAAEGGGQVEIKCNYRKNSNHLTVEISDSGDGFDKEIINRVFEPFFSTRKKGSGLGLSIAKAISDEHKGEITITNNSPTGATVTIKLPVDNKSITEV